MTANIRNERSGEVKPAMRASQSFVYDAVHIFVLSAFAVAQPLYDLLGQNPEFFIAHRASPATIAGVVLLLSLAIPLGLVLIELAIRPLSEGFRRGMHWVFVLGLMVLIALPVVKSTFSETDAVILATVLTAGFVCAVLYARWRALRMFVTMLSPAVLVFPLWFMAFTPAGRLVLPQAVEVNAGVEIKNPATVVLIVFDEFNTTALLDETGKIDAIRFPNFAALVTESWWFPNAVGTHVATEKAVPAILTGRQARIEKVSPTATGYPESLFTLLGEQYRLNVFEAMTALCPATLCRKGDVQETPQSPALLFADMAAIYLHIITPPAMAQRLPSLDAQWTGFGEGLIGKAKRVKRVQPPRGFQEKERQLMLSSLEKKSDKELHFFHVMLPHVPYVYMPPEYIYNSGAFFPDGMTNDRHWWEGGEPLTYVAYYRYLQQVGYVDQFFGEIINKLKTNGLYDNSLIVVTADHGVSFRTGSYRRLVNNGNQADVLKVPMFVKLPGQSEGRIDERLVGGIDIVPTIADILGIDVPWKIDGRSMFNNELPQRINIDINGIGRFPAKDLAGFPRLDWQVEHFGAHTPLDRLALKGPHPGLVGQDLAGLRLGKATALQLVSDDMQRFEDVDIGSRFLPALVRAVVEGTDNRNLPLAIALNGRIWATTTTIEWGGSLRYFTAMFPPVAFKDGRNVLDVLLIEETAEGPLLRSILPDQDHGQVALHRGPSGQESLVLSGGQEIPVNADWDTIPGNLDQLILLRGNEVVIDGWAADIAHSAPVDTLYVFLGERYVTNIKPRNPRKDLVKVYGQQSLLMSGFTALIPLEWFGSGADDIRIFAVSRDGRAGEIRHSGEAAIQIYKTFGRRQLGREVDVTLHNLPTGGEGLVYADGRVVPVNADGVIVRSHLDHEVTLDENLLFVQGWAADLVKNRPARAVLFFAGDRLVADVTPRFARPDVAKALGKESTLYSGFKAIIPLEFIKSDVEKIRVFAISHNDDNADELEFTENELREKFRAAIKENL